ncbi:MAG: ATP-grasp domain-containing protein [Gaiellales bacterium]
MNVLLTCVGLRVDVVTAFREAVARHGGGLVIGTDSSPIAPALPFCDVQVAAPPASDPGYADHVLATARAHGCAMVLPCSEWDLVLLADLAPRLAEIGCRAFLPDGEATRRCVDKLAMADYLAAQGLDTPRTFHLDRLPDDLRFPVLVKMREGRGSEGIYRCADRRELDFFLGYTPLPSMVQECCAGTEYSIDVLCDLDARCLDAIPRSMIQSKGGEQIKGTTIEDPVLVEVGRTVAEALGLRGPGTIQCFREGDRHEVTDVNPRIGGAFPLPLAAGGDFPYRMVQLAAGEALAPRLGEYTRGVTLSRFFHQVLFTGDDEATLPDLKLAEGGRS